MFIILAVLLISLLFLLIKYTFKTIVILLLSFIVLHLTNPSKEKFKSYFSNEISKAEVNQDLVNKLALEGIKLQSNLTLEQKNLEICSIYQVNYLDKKEGYLGIFNLFIHIYEK